MENEPSLSVEDYAPLLLPPGPAEASQGTIFGTTRELSPEELEKRVREHARQMTPRT